MSNNMNKNIEITKIKLTISGNTIEINAKAARQLYEELKGIFEDASQLEQEYRKIVPKEKEYIPYPVYLPAPQPYWDNNPTVLPYQAPLVWCKTLGETVQNNHNIESCIVSTEIH